jgi:hypothetical protein
MSSIRRATPRARQRRIDRPRTVLSGLPQQIERLQLHDLNLKRALAKLSDEQRSVVLLIGLEGERYDAVASLFGDADRHGAFPLGPRSQGVVATHGWRSRLNSSARAARAWLSHDGRGYVDHAAWSRKRPRMPSEAFVLAIDAFASVSIPVRALIASIVSGTTIAWLSTR